MDTASSVVFLIVIGLYLAFWFRALYEAIRAPIGFPLKTLWVVAILFFQLIGPILWYAVGPRPGRRRLLP